MPPPIFLPILLLSLCCFPFGSKGTEDELQILLDLKTSLGITNTAKGFESWASSSPCHFSGIYCNSDGSVEKIDLYNRGISGTIPFHSICQLSSLTNLTLGTNNLFGTLTSYLQNCTHLQHLDLSFNDFHGTVPDLSPLNQLQVLKLSENDFTGVFPWSSLGNLTGTLTYLSLGDNSFDASPFPDVVSNLTKLYWLYLSDCNLHGEIPASIGNLTELVDLEIADNFLSGEMPPEIVKLNKLQQLELYNNSLTGRIPRGFGNLSDLAFFDASMNQLEGDLGELRLLTKLVSLQLFMNRFSGGIPPEFGDFRFLVNFSLYTNRLSGELPPKLGSWSAFNFIDVSTNFLTGPIPPDMCKLGTMKKLLMLENKFSGEIPASYANCSSLIRFRVNNNSLSGVVPAGIWSLPNLNIIDLTSNRFEGPITPGIGKAKSLNQLLLANNRLSGEIPSEISEAWSLYSIDVTDNRFSGPIPTSIGGLKSLGSLDLGMNSFSGEIPDSIGSCVHLTSVNLPHNSLSGEIPASLGRLPSLNTIDLSNNQLSGQIPATLSSLKLSALDFSNNRLTGQIPAALAISAFNGSFAGNPSLCSNFLLDFRPCSSTSGKASSTLRTILTCFLAGFAFILCSIGFVLYLKKRRSDAEKLTASKDSWDLKSFRILSFDEQEIINSINKENIIGKGGSGNVYRAVLGTGKAVAVKHIWHSPDPDMAGERNGTAAMLTKRSSSMRSREFDAEVNTLSSIRHVNVVKLYCSISSEDSSLLVYEHLPNGSLWDRLHTVAGEKLGLDWETRYEVAVGAARGLEYLHHGCDRPILHRDVKSSNILLDEFFKPRIADFGLAKILHSSAAAGKESSSHVIAGTHGYIAPEYGYTWKVNEKSDVYSFGVVLLELVTGRRPIEGEYGDNKDIVYWVAEKMTSRENIMSIVDAAILSQAAREEAVKILKVGVLCTARLPTMRPTMRTVVQMLEDAGSSRAIAVIELNDQKAKLEKISSYKGKLSP